MFILLVYYRLKLGSRGCVINVFLVHTLKRPIILENLGIKGEREERFSLPFIFSTHVQEIK